MTVQEYAEKRGVSLAAVYKMIKENRIRHDTKYGKKVVFGAFEKEISK